MKDKWNQTARSSLLGYGLAVILIVSLAGDASAWGIKGHTMANEAATAGLPSELPHFFHDAYPQLVYLGYDPDRWRSGGPSLTSLNFPDHFLDYEYVADLELPARRYDFIELLHDSGTLERYGIRQTTPGFAPWKIAEILELIENQWRIWLRDDLNEAERKQVEQNIVHYSGVLGHFVADSANPHHATIHYNGWAIAPNPENYPNDCGVHWRFESEFVTRAVSLDQVIAAMDPLTERTEYFEEALGFILDSQLLVDEIYALDRDGGFTGQGTEAGEAFATARLARGASWLRDLWVSAWRAAHEDR